MHLFIQVAFKLEELIFGGDFQHFIRSDFVILTSCSMFFFSGIYDILNGPVIFRQQIFLSIENTDTTVFIDNGEFCKR